MLNLKDLSWRQGITMWIILHILSSIRGTIVKVSFASYSCKRSGRGKRSKAVLDTVKEEKSN